MSSHVCGEWNSSACRRVLSTCLNQSWMIPSIGDVELRKPAASLNYKTILLQSSSCSTSRSHMTSSPRRRRQGARASRHPDTIRPLPELAAGSVGIRLMALNMLCIIEHGPWSGGAGLSLKARAEWLAKGRSTLLNSHTMTTFPLLAYLDRSRAKGGRDGSENHNRHCDRCSRRDWRILRLYWWLLLPD